MKQSLEKLQETHGEMLITADDLGLEVPEELKADFTDVKAGATINKNLDALIREHRAKVAEDDEKSDNVESEEEVAPPVAKKPAAKKKAASKKAKPSSAKKVDEQQGEETVAVAAKKTAKKSTAKKAAKKKATANARTRVSFDPTKKIQWVAGKENPCRKGTGKFQRVEKVKAASGKTIETYLKAKGKKGSLNWCVKNGLVKVA